MRNKTLRFQLFKKENIMNHFTSFNNQKNTGIITGIFMAVSLFAFMPTAGAGDMADSATLKKWISEKALIVDVRTTEEFAAGNYKGSINIPLAEVENNIKRFGNKDQKIIVYCRSGNRSGQAKKILEKHGYKNVLNGGGLVNMP